MHSPFSGLHWLPEQLHCSWHPSPYNHCGHAETRTNDYEQEPHGIVCGEYHFKYPSEGYWWLLAWSAPYLFIYLFNSILLVRNQCPQVLQNRPQTKNSHSHYDTSSGKHPAPLPKILWKMWLVLRWPWVIFLICIYLFKFIYLFIHQDITGLSEENNAWKCKTGNEKKKSQSR